jgi:hypothetical protein
LNIDAFAACFFANIVAMNIFLPVFKREYKAGLYSMHVYYFGNLLAKLMCLSFYPVLIFSLLFFNLEVKDSSQENFVEFLKVACLLALNAVSLGHMWSCIFDSDMNAIISGFGILTACICGSGALGSRNNLGVATLIKLSPQSYTLELIIRRILHNNVAKDLVLNRLQLLNGEETCWNTLLIQSAIAITVGWVIQVYKCKFLY